MMTSSSTAFPDLSPNPLTVTLAASAPDKSGDRIGGCHAQIVVFREIQKEPPDILF
jgi:hypothetical protein